MSIKIIQMLIPLCNLNYHEMLYNMYKCDESLVDIKTVSDYEKYINNNEIDQNIVKTLIHMYDGAIRDGEVICLKDFNIFLLAENRVITYKDHNMNHHEICNKMIESDHFKKIKSNYRIIDINPEATWIFKYIQDDEVQHEYFFLDIHKSQNIASTDITNTASLLKYNDLAETYLPYMSNESNFGKILNK